MTITVCEKETGALLASIEIDAVNGNANVIAHDSVTVEIDGDDGKPVLRVVK